MRKIYFQRRKIIIMIICVFLLILSGIFCFYQINMTRLQNIENSLVHKSEFYKLMYRENDFDFIKTGEKELENIDIYI